MSATDCTCCGQELDSAIDDLAMELCGFCLPPHSDHSDTAGRQLPVVAPSGAVLEQIGFGR